jgi:hypothetical protein
MVGGISNMASNHITLTSDQVRGEIAKQRGPTGGQRRGYSNPRGGQAYSR